VTLNILLNAEARLAGAAALPRCLDHLRTVAPLVGGRPSVRAAAALARAATATLNGTAATTPAQLDAWAAALHAYAGDAPVTAWPAASTPRQRLLAAVVDVATAAVVAEAAQGGPPGPPHQLSLLVLGWLRLAPAALADCADDAAAAAWWAALGDRARWLEARGGGELDRRVDLRIADELLQHGAGAAAVRPWLDRYVARPDAPFCFGGTISPQLFGELLVRLAGTPAGQAEALVLYRRARASGLDPPVGGAAAGRLAQALADAPLLDAAAGELAAAVWADATADAPRAAAPGVYTVLGNLKVAAGAAHEGAALDADALARLAGNVSAVEARLRAQPPAAPTRAVAPSASLGHAWAGPPAPAAYSHGALAAPPAPAVHVALA